ncbi:MAG: SO2930 family diheme c-type cytochrome [Balneolaceae bacterium]|nr:SO2930 family diheme c-type cytochrome [Balneolaceae bacterium]
MPENEPYERLSEYKLFVGDMNELKPYDKLIPYDLNTELFSDYTDKRRMVYIPPGRTVKYEKHGVLNFPVGTMLVKNFYYERNQQTKTEGRRILETRLLIRYETGWTAETYVWNDEQTEAFLVRTGDQKTVNWIDKNGTPRMVNYLIPTKNDCKTCHSRAGSLVPLGPKVRNLNKVYQYGEQVQNQLERWEWRMFLRDKPGLEQIPKTPVWDDPKTGTVAERARTYLDVNCSTCHHPAGTANNSGLFLSLEEENPLRLGVCKPPVAPGSGSGGLSYNIVPCQPDQSILHFRMQSVKPQERMPEIGRTLVHEEAVELIRQWIQQMECAACDI